MPNMHCPLCGHRLTVISPHRDYFCRPCQAGVCVDRDEAYVYEPDLERASIWPAGALLRPEAG